MPEELTLAADDINPAEYWDDATALQLAEEADWAARPAGEVAVLGARTLASFGDTGRPGLLAVSISLLEDAYGRSDELSESEWADTALCLGEALREGADAFDEPDWLPEAIAAGEAAVEAGAGAWGWFALCETYRRTFRVTGLSAHLYEALHCARTASTRATPDDVSALLSNLGAVALQAADDLAEPHLLDEAAEAVTSAVRLTRRDDPHRAVYLANLALILSAIAERDANSRVARWSVRCATRALACESVSVGALLAAAQCHETLGDLTNDSNAFVEACRLVARADLAARGTPRRPGVLLERSRLAQRRFDREGEPELLELATRYAERAVILQGGRQRATAESLLNLAVCRTRCCEIGLTGPRTNARSLAALALDKADAAQRPQLRGDAALVWLSHHERTGSAASLRTAIGLLREATESPRARPRTWSNLAGALLSAFDNDPSESLIREAMKASRRARDATPAGRDRVVFEAVLASCLEAAFQASGDLGHLREGARHARRAARRLDPQSPDSTAIRTNCAVTLRTSYQYLGVPKDLALAVQLIEQAVAGAPRGALPTCQTQLVATLLTRFEAAGDPSDLQQALMATTQLENSGARITRAGAATISSCHLAAYEASGHISQLDAAVRWARTALGRRARRAEVRASALTSLANALFSRFEVVGEQRDLTEAVQRARQAIRATPLESPSIAGRYANLANALRAQASLGLGSGKKALQAAERSVRLAAAKDHQLPAYLSGLALALSELGRHAEASLVLRHAVAACPRSSPARHFYRTNLAASLRDEFESGGSRQTINEAIRILSRLPHSDAPWGMVGRTVLGDCLRARDLPGDRELAFECWASVHDDRNAPAWLRLLAARAAADAAATAAPPDWPRAAASFVLAVKLHERTAWHGLAWSSRRRFLAAQPNLGVDAAAVALQIDEDPETVIDLLESGRDIVWRDRAARRVVRSDHTLMRRLRRLSDELDELDRGGPGSPAQRLT